MNGRILVGLFLCSLFLVVGGDAQSPDIPFSGYMRADGEKPIWALEFIKVQPENFAVAMQYLDDNWMRVRAEAKRHGAVLDYHSIPIPEPIGCQTGGVLAVHEGIHILVFRQQYN